MFAHFNWVTAADFVRSLLAALTASGVVLFDADQTKAIVGVIGAIVLAVLTFVKPKAVVTSVAVGSHPRSYDER